jgi:hypothetical protein
MYANDMRVDKIYETLTDNGIDTWEFMQTVNRYQAGRLNLINRPISEQMAHEAHFTEALQWWENRISWWI